MILCDYGCGQEAKHQLKNGKWCCNKTHRSCPTIKKIFSESHKGHKSFMKGKKYEEIYGIEKSKNLKKIQSEKRKGRILSKDHKEKISNSLKGENNPFYEKQHTDESKKKISEKMQGKNHPFYGKSRSEETKKKISESNKGKIISDTQKKKIKETLKGKMVKEKNPFYRKKHSEKSKKIMRINSLLTIKKIKQRHQFFSKIEEMRYNPDNPEEKEIQVHCKNNKCLNSKEQGGWFTPTQSQIYERMRQVENPNGNDGGYLYCSNECKDICPLFNLKSDPNKNIEKCYTKQEYQTFRQTVLNRDNYICQYCGKLAEHVHHEIPQKIDPYLSLDPETAISVCKECHYQKGHKDECSTGNLAYFKKKVK